MSHWIVDFDVHGVTESDEMTVWHLLAAEGAELRAAFGDDESTSFTGEITLAGETPDAAHSRIRNALQRKLVSKWICLDELDWDFVIEDEPT